LGVEAQAPNNVLVLLERLRHQVARDDGPLPAGGGARLVFAHLFVQRGGSGGRRFPCARLVLDLGHGFAGLFLFVSDLLLGF
jgi:hypothetical protein